MPIYEFKCDKCGLEFESIDLGGHDNALSCPGCGSQNLKKLFSTFATPKHPLPKGGLTCCGREERCDAPQCGPGGSCCQN
ncbi:MAG: zinc ribbon domain-containing protein [Actinobacteria bacterium]|nr:zinc ribbon domain-containing protein [Actinomycetota bacterium]